MFPPPDRYSLTLNGEPYYGTCAPLAIGMVTGYWNQRNPTRWQAVAPQTLIDTNADKFSEFGIGVHQFESNLRDAGYRYKTYMNSDFDTLRTVVGREPVIAHVQWEFRPGGGAHVVVVHKIDQDNVYVADPGTATEYSVPVETFRHAWEGDWGGQPGVFHVVGPPSPYWKETTKAVPPKRAANPWAGETRQSNRAVSQPSPSAPQSTAPSAWRRPAWRDRNL